MFRRLLPLLFMLIIPAMAEEYEVSINQLAQVGQTKLAPGRYKVKVQGSVAIFTDVATSKSLTALARVERLEKRSQYSAIIGSVEGGLQKVDKLVISGADFALGFAN